MHDVVLFPSKIRMQNFLKTKPCVENQNIRELWQYARVKVAQLRVFIK